MIHVSIFTYTYIYTSGHKWSIRHRMLKFYRSKIGVLYMCSHENSSHFPPLLPKLSLQWLCGNSCTWAHDVRLHIAGTNEAKSAQHKWSTTHRVHKPHTSKMGEICMYSYENNVHPGYHHNGFVLRLCYTPGLHSLLNIWLIGTSNV